MDQMGTQAPVWRLHEEKEKEMKNESAEKLKHLQTRRSSLQLEIDQAMLNKQDVTKRLDVMLQQRNSIDEEIKQLSMKAEQVIVSEHAILRYLERAMNLDLDAIKKEILSESLVASCAAFRSGKFPIGRGIKAVVKNNVIVTVET